MQLMAHMFVPTYYLIIKFHLLEEKVYQYKILWFIVVLTCSLRLYGQDRKAVHMIHVFFLRLLTIAV